MSRSIMTAACMGASADKILAWCRSIPAGGCPAVEQCRGGHAAALRRPSRVARPGRALCARRRQRQRPVLRDCSAQGQEGTAALAAWPSADLCTCTVSDGLDVLPYAKRLHMLEPSTLTTLPQAALRSWSMRNAASILCSAAICRHADGFQHTDQRGRVALTS